MVDKTTMKPNALHAEFCLKWIDALLTEMKMKRMMTKLYHKKLVNYLIFLDIYVLM